MVEVAYGVEGLTDVPVAERLIAHVGRTPRRAYVGGGKAQLDARICRWNQPGNRLPFLVLRDWDLDFEFGSEHWEPARAAVRSPSLDRTIRRLEALATSGTW